MTFLSDGRQLEVSCFPVELVFTLPHLYLFTSIFSLVETIRSKISERPLSWHEKFSLPVSDRGSKTSLA